MPSCWRVIIMCDIPELNKYYGSSPSLSFLQLSCGRLFDLLKEGLMMNIASLFLLNTIYILRQRVENLEFMIL